MSLLLFGFLVMVEGNQLPDIDQNAQNVLFHTEVTKANDRAGWGFVKFFWQCQYRAVCYTFQFLLVDDSFVPEDIISSVSVPQC